MMAQAPERQIPRPLDPSVPSVLLGVNAWAVATLVPFLLHGEPTPAGLVLLTLPLAALWGAVPLLRDENRGGPWLLLGVFPLTLALALGFLGDQSGGGLTHRVLSSLSFLAFVVGANHWLGASVTPRHAAHRPLPPSPEPRDALARERLRRAVLALASAGALALTIVAPEKGPEELASAWGEAAGAAATLTATAGSILGVTLLAIFVAPSFRRTRTRPPSREQMRLRVAALLLLVLAGAFTWYVVQRGGPPLGVF